jgi:hypothetical protein
MQRPAQQSGLMELGNAFQAFVPELRTMLRDASAREDSDARALGEQEAEALYRQGRLEEINATLKAKADSGEIPRHAVPSYYQGAAFRFGAHAADKLNADLLKTVNEAAVNGNAEEHIKAALNVAASKVNQNDLYARAGFDQASQQIIGSYRQRVAMQAATNFEQQAEYEAAQTGYRSVSELATAPADQVPAVLERMKAGLDFRRGQVNPTIVNDEFLEKSVKPAISDLFTQHRYEEAHQLISRLRSFDVTGQGGMFGKIASVSYQLDVLEQAAIKQGEQHAKDINEQLKRDLETAQLSAGKFVTDTLESAKESGQPFLPSDIDAAVSAWAKNLPASIDKHAYTRAARESFAHELSQETKQKRELYDGQVGAFMSKMTSLKPEDIDRYEAYAASVEANDFATPENLKEMRSRISSLRARSGLVTDQHVSRAVSNVFPVVRDRISGETKLTAQFPDNATEAGAAWEALGNDGKGRVQGEVNDWIVDQLRERTGDIADLRMADAEMQKILPQVITDAQKQAARVAVRVFKDEKKAIVMKKTVEAARLIKFLDTSGTLDLQNHRAVDDRYTRVTRDVSGNVLDVEKKNYEPPEHSKAAQYASMPGGGAEYRSVPPAERDAAPVFMERGFWSARWGSTWVDLGAVANDINQTDDPDKSAKALEVYGNAKGRLGFTPDEVMKQVTKHGVPFVAKEIDPRFTPVFRTVAELEDAWNDGKPKPLFFQMKTAVADPDPKHPMSKGDFYTAQRLRLSASR